MDSPPPPKFRVTPPWRKAPAPNPQEFSPTPPWRATSSQNVHGTPAWEDTSSPPRFAKTPPWRKPSAPLLTATTHFSLLGNDFPPASTISRSREHSLGSDAMEEEVDEDLYGNNGHSHGQEHKQEDARAEAAPQDLEEGEEESSDDDDEDELEVDLGNNDIKLPTALPTRYGAQFKTESTSTGAQARGQPQVQQGGLKPSNTPSQAPAFGSGKQDLYSPPELVLRDGRNYPPVRTSKIDVDGDPMWNGKKISELDIDADLAEHMKPWRAPGADQSDYFNYGFDEFTWAQYNMRRRGMETELSSMRDNQQTFDAMFSGLAGMAGGSAAGGPPSGPGQGPSANGNGGMGMGMPNDNDMMQVMQQLMAQQGINDPTQIDFAAFMQQMGGFPGAAPPQGPSGNVPSGPAAWQGGGGGQGGAAGRGGRGGRRW